MYNLIMFLRSHGYPRMIDLIHCDVKILPCTLRTESGDMRLVVHSMQEVNKDIRERSSENVDLL